MRKHELHGHGRRVVVAEHGHQGAAFEVLLGLVAEHAAQAEAVAGGGELGVGLVGADDEGVGGDGFGFLEPHRIHDADELADAFIEQVDLFRFELPLVNSLFHSNSG